MYIYNLLSIVQGDALNSLSSCESSKEKPVFRYRSGYRYNIWDQVKWQAIFNSPLI